MESGGDKDSTYHRAGRQAVAGKLNSRLLASWQEVVGFRLVKQFADPIATDAKSQESPE